MQDEYLDMPLGGFLVPDCFRHLTFELDGAHTTILLGNAFPIPMNLRCFGIEARPSLVRLEAGLVGMSRDICSLLTLDDTFSLPG